jgi:hypothetical protein
MSLHQVTAVFELTSYIVVVLGVPIGLFQYHQAKVRERQEREARVFDAVSASYLDFQRTCLQYPFLDVFDIPDASPTALSPAQQKEELIAFAMLFSIFERAYLLYLANQTPVTEAQWQGWDQHVRGYFRRENFRRAWHTGEGSYDPRFNEYMRRIEDEAGAHDLTSLTRSGRAGSFS